MRRSAVHSPPRPSRAAKGQYLSHCLPTPSRCSKYCKRHTANPARLPAGRYFKLEQGNTREQQECADLAAAQAHFASLGWPEGGLDVAPEDGAAGCDGALGALLARALALQEARERGGLAPDWEQPEWRWEGAQEGLAGCAFLGWCRAPKASRLKARLPFHARPAPLPIPGAAHSMQAGRPGGNAGRPQCQAAAGDRGAGCDSGSGGCCPGRWPSMVLQPMEAILRQDAADQPLGMSRQLRDSTQCLPWRHLTPRC